MKYKLLLFIIVIPFSFFAQDPLDAKKELYENIKWAEELMKNFNVGDDLGEVPVDTYEDLEVQIVKADEVYRDYSVNYEEIVQADMILFANIESFYNSIVLVNEIGVDDLQDLIDKCEIKIELSRIGEYPGQYSASDLIIFLSEMNEAKTRLSENIDFTPEQAMEIFLHLEESSYKFDLSKNEGILHDSLQKYPDADFSTLDAQINNADFLYYTSTVGNDIGDHAKKDYDYLYDNISVSKRLLEYKKIDQKAVEYMAEKLDYLVIEYIVNEITAEDKLKEYAINLMNFEFGDEVSEYPDVLSEEVAFILDSAYVVLNSNDINAITGYYYSLLDKTPDYKLYVNTDTVNKNLLRRIITDAEKILTQINNEDEINKIIDQVEKANSVLLDELSCQKKVNEICENLYQTILNVNSFVEIYNADNYVSIAPNPCGGFVRVQVPKNAVHVKMCNSQGRMLWSEINPNEEFYVDMSYYPSGIYVFDFFIDEIRHFSQLIIKK